MGRFQNLNSENRNFLPALPTRNLFKTVNNLQVKNYGNPAGNVFLRIISLNEQESQRCPAIGCLQLPADCHEGSGWHFEWIHQYPL
jgi:hypothetical protein